MRMKRSFKAIPVLVAGLFTSPLSIAAGSVSADPHAGHDMSSMQMPADENFTEMTSMEPIVTESRTPIPPVTDADRKAAFGNLQGMRFTTVQLIIWFCWISWNGNGRITQTISAGVLTAGLEATQTGFG